VRLLEAFSPLAWNEEAYIRNPPFVSEGVDGSLIVVPLVSDAENALEKMRTSLGLKRVQDNPPYYQTSRNDAVRAVRTFNWFARRSWRDKNRAVLWALVHECGRKGQAQTAIVSPETLAELSGCEPKLCADIAAKLLGPNNHRAHNGSHVSYEVDVAKVHQALGDSIEDIPSWTEEQLMSVLCSEAGASAAELYDQVDSHDLTIGALYKTTERLKQEGYVQAARHFRVNDRGPMREFLSSDCRNCFYGFSGAENCLEDAFRQLEYVLKRYYGKELSEDERTDSRSAVRSVPVNPRVLRRALEALGLIQRMRVLMGEKQVTRVLGKIEEWYGVEFPLQLTGDDASNISPAPN